MIKGLITAIRTLSIIPVYGRDAKDFSEAVIWFGFVGFVLGFVLFGFIKVLCLLTNYCMLAALFGVAASAVLTRGIHLDGLADFADGFGGGYEKEQILSIMKDSNIGTFGALALIFILALKWVSLFYLIKNKIFIAVIPAYTASRFVMSDLSSRLKYARNTMGTAKPFVENTGKKQLIISLTAALFLSFVVCGFCGVVMVFFALFISFVLGFYFVKKIGGITGDLLGAACEITETALLLFALFFMKYIPYQGIFA